MIKHFDKKDVFQICAGETKKDISSSLVVRSRVSLKKIFFIGLGAERPREDFLRVRENRSGRGPVFGGWRLAVVAATDERTPI